MGLVSELQTQYSDLTGYGQDIAAAFETALAKEIGRASCRERVSLR